MAIVRHLNSIDLSNCDDAKDLDRKIEALILRGVAELMDETLGRGSSRIAPTKGS
jgi:hypothetical protein